MHPDVKHIEKVLTTALDRLESDRLLNKLGLAGIRKIKSRTRQGKDFEGKAFQKYSAGYKKKRQDAGLPTHLVNLEFDDINGMLQTMDHIIAADRKSVALDFTDEDKRTIASYHNELGAGKSKVKREFFGLNEDDQKDISKIIADDLVLILRSLI